MFVVIEITQEPITSGEVIDAFRKAEVEAVHIAGTRKEAAEVRAAFELLANPHQKYIISEPTWRMLNG